MTEIIPNATDQTFLWAALKAHIKEQQAQQVADTLAFGCRLSQEMFDLERETTDWSYRAPRSDDWHQWTGALRFAALSVLCELTAALIRDGGLAPFYCPDCTEPEQAAGLGAQGWNIRQCVNCMWLESGYDKALAFARAIGREFVQRKGEAA